MKYKQIKKMLIEVISELDYDLAKDFDPLLAEDAELAKEKLGHLISIIDKYVNKKVKKVK
jgi:hypothetical protein